MERAEPQTLIGMNKLFLSHRVQHVVFEVNSPSEIEIMFDIGYGCSAIDDHPRCSYGATRHARKGAKTEAPLQQVTGREFPDVGKFSLSDECFFYNMDEANTFFRTHLPPKRRGYHNVHCFLRSDAVSTEAIVLKEAEKFTGKVLSYDGCLFELASVRGRPFLRELRAGEAGPGLPVEAVSFRTMFLIESDLK